MDDGRFSTRFVKGRATIEIAGSVPETGPSNAQSLHVKLEKY